MSFWIAPMCMECRHLRPDGISCTPFPEGIPIDIYEWRHDHRLPFPGDGGITFEPADPEAWEQSVLHQLADTNFGVPAETGEG